MSSYASRLSIIAILLTLVTTAGLVISLYRELEVIEVTYKKEIPLLMTLGAALRYEDKVHSDFRLSLHNMDHVHVKVPFVEDGTLAGDLESDMDRLNETLSEIARIDRETGRTLKGLFDAAQSIDRRILVAISAGDRKSLSSLLAEREQGPGRSFRLGLQQMAEDLSIQRDRSLGEQNYKFQITLIAALVAIFIVSVFWIVVVYAFRRAKEERIATEITLEHERAIRVHAVKLGALGEMAGGIAHEINNPLAIIGGSVQQILEDTADPNLKIDPELHLRLVKNGERISRTVSRIGKIVSSLRTFARDGDKDVHRYTLLSQIVEDVLALSTERTKHAGIEMRVGPYEAYEIYCNQVQLEQVLVNLLNNSVDAIIGTTDPWIELGFTYRGNALRMEVTDSGAGIAPAIVDKMMNPFFTTKEVGKGTGLGLSVSMGIAKAHSGRLFYEAAQLNDATHTRFVLELPATLVRPAQISTPVSKLSS